MNLFNAALQVTAIGMTGIFIFMFIFYVSIRVIDKLFPAEAKQYA
jgi:Na+-transporting methylmalonyl-CoA/oxaloacetate decarboxylase gamma subunit